MSNKKPVPRKNSVAAATSSMTQAQKAERAERKKFLKQMINAPRLVTFTGGGSISHFGFKTDGDLLLFLMDQVYGWKGDNVVFQSILQKIVAPKEQGPTEEDKEVDELFDEEEDSEVQDEIDSEVTPITDTEAEQLLADHAEKPAVVTEVKEVDKIPAASVEELADEITRLKALLAKK